MRVTKIFLFEFQLKEIGPYIYSTKSKKVGVKFENGKVTSTSFDQAKFNKTLTKKECPKCNENDKVCFIFFNLMNERKIVVSFHGSIVCRVCKKETSNKLPPADHVLITCVSRKIYQNVGLTKQ